MISSGREWKGAGGLEGTAEGRIRCLSWEKMGRGVRVSGSSTRRRGREEGSELDSVAYL